MRDSVKFLLPLFLFLLLFVLVPVSGTLINSLFEDVSFLSRRFILFKNYARLLTDRLFWQSVRFTLFFLLVSVPLELALGMVFALPLNMKIPGRGLLRAAVLVPWVIPAAISARTWELIYNYHYGLANFCLRIIGFGDAGFNWLGTGFGAFSAVVLADVWKTTPFVAVIFLAGLQAVPDEIYEQARIDRANFWQIFTRITLPILKPVIVVALLFRTIDALRIFDLIYVLTGGGPGGATTSVSLYAYQYFLNGDFGYGAVVSVVLFIIAFSFSLLYVKAARFSSEEI